MIDAAEPAEAIDLLSEYLESAPGDAEAHALLGVAYYNAGKPWNAERHLKHSLVVLPDQRPIQTLLCRILMDRHAWEDALEVAAALKRENPSDAVIRVMYESCLENVDRPEVGWEKQEKLGRHRVEFTNGGPD